MIHIFSLLIEKIVEINELFDLIHIFFRLILLAITIIGAELRIIDLQCTTDLQVSKRSCYIDEYISAEDGDTINFINTDKWKNISYFKIKTQKNLTFVPPSIFETFPNIRAIRLSVGIKSLSKDSLKNADQLHTLELQKNAIEKIPSGVFANARHLKEIDLSVNQISEIEDNAFDGLDKLMFIYLEKNRIKTLKNGTFAGAGHLSGLRLGENEIETIEDGAFNLPELNTLFLGSNKIKTLSDSIFNGAQKLQAIDLRLNSIVYIGRAFDNLKELVVLNLNSNKIADLSLEKLAALPELLQLLLNNTGFKFHENAASAFTNSKLQSLDLSGNGLSNPDILKRLTPFTALQALGLQDNSLETIDDLANIKTQFNNMTIISISGNKFKCNWLEQSLKRLTQVGVAVVESVGYGSTEKNVNGVSCF